MAVLDLISAATGTASSALGASRNVARRVRVLFHPSRHDKMPARGNAIAPARTRPRSVAVKPLERRSCFPRRELESDRQLELRNLTKAGAAAYSEPSAIARD